LYHRLLGNYQIWNADPVDAFTQALNLQLHKLGPANLNGNEANGLQQPDETTLPLEAQDWYKFHKDQLIGNDQVFVNQLIQSGGADSAPKVVDPD